MAEGGLAMDKSPSPPKMDWSKQSPLEMTGSLTDHLHRLLSIKNQPPQSNVDSESSGPSVESNDVVAMKRLLTERDEMWREHERSQIAFMEKEHERTLRGLHKEIERLQSRCAELTRQLSETVTIIEPDGPAGSGRDSDDIRSIASLESQLQSTRLELATVRELHERKREHLDELERTCGEQESKHKEELERKNQQLLEIGADLNQKTAMIAQLTTQLHQLRLREAVERQRIEQRRQLAEQQAKRRQALAAAKSDHHHHPIAKNSPTRSHTMPPSKITVQVSAEPSSASSSNNSRRPPPPVPAATRMAATNPSGPPRRTRSLALPSITSSLTTTSSPQSTSDGSRDKIMTRSSSIVRSRQSDQ